MESSADQNKNENFMITDEIDNTIHIENPASPDLVAEKDSQLEKPIFSQKFYCQSRVGVNEHTLSVTQNYIMIDDQVNTNILLHNIIGASVAKVSLKDRAKLKFKDLGENEDVFGLTIHLFSKVTSNPLFGSKVTKRKPFDLTYYTLNEQTALSWKNMILQVANNPAFAREAYNYSSADQVPPFKRLLLVFVNPSSGKKLAPARWAKAKAFLLKGGCEFVEVMTQYSGHARDYVVKHELSTFLNFDGIITVSGDGLPHEVINGLCSRPDWESIKHIPLGPLPGGSGNAIVKNLLARAGEFSSLFEACFLIAKGRSTQADLSVIEMPDKPVVYSFLSFVWAAMAHIDIESEVVRWLGAFRFDLFGVLAILKMKKYRAKLTYTSESDPLPPFNEEIVGDNWVRIEDSFSYFNLHKMRYITEECVAAPITDFQDGYNHLLALKGNANTRMKMTKILLGLGSGLLSKEEDIKKVGMLYSKIKSFRLVTEDVQNSFYSIDGERYESKVVQGYIKEKALTLFCTK